LLWKTIRLPSGDHAGAASTARVVTSRFTCEPSAFITKSCPVETVSPRTNAIRLPSGERAGSVSSRMFLVSRLSPRPSTPTE